jgi:multicomponent Na+:H+ antiporter subunit E
MRTALRFAATAAAAFVVYLLLAGSLGGAEIALGAGVAVLAAALTARALPFGPALFDPLRVARTVAYLPVFVWKMIVANLEIAAIVVRPHLGVKPSLVKAATDLRSPEGLLLLTSSITLTPGTLSVDARDGELYVHWVVAEADDDETARRRILLPFERRIRGIAG